MTLSEKMEAYICALKRRAPQGQPFGILIDIEEEILRWIAETRDLEEKACRLIAYQVESGPKTRKCGACRWNPRAKYWEAIMYARYGDTVHAELTQSNFCHVCGQELKEPCDCECAAVRNEADAENDLRRRIEQQMPTTVELGPGVDYANHCYLIEIIERLKDMKAIMGE